MLHPVPHRVSREPLLLFSALPQEVLRHLRRLTHPVDPDGPDVSHRADGSLGQGSNRLEVWNQRLHGVDVGVGHALDFRPGALHIVYASLSDTKDARLSCGGCARDCFGCFALRPLGSRFLFSLVFRFLTLLPKLCPLLFHLFLTRLFGRNVPRPLSFCLPLGFLALLPGLQPPLLQLVLPSLLGLGNAGLDFLSDTLHLFFAQCPLHRGQQFALFVAGVLAEGFLQLLEPLGEALIVLRQCLEFSKLRPKFPIVLDRVGDKPLRFGIPPQNGEKVLLFKSGVQFQLGFQVRERASPWFSRRRLRSQTAWRTVRSLWQGPACISVRKLIVSPLPAAARQVVLMGRQTRPALAAGANKVLPQTLGSQPSCKRTATAAALKTHEPIVRWRPDSVQTDSGCTRGPAATSCAIILKSAARFRGRDMPST